MQSSLKSRLNLQRHRRFVGRTSVRNAMRDLHRAPERTFFHPAPTREQAAILMNLPFSTYRCHLKGGIIWGADTLWQKEIGIR